MPAHVPHRQFKSDDGDLWDVWEVSPQVGQTDIHEPWLCFENQRGERWRFSPIPHGWDETSDAVLRVLLSVAAPAPKRSI
jgi:hypothetical protein